MLKRVRDPRHHSYITYPGHVLLMTRILSSIFYISSMGKTSAEFNSEMVIKNTAFLCGEPGLSEMPYWETINDFLKKLEPEQLQGIVCRMVKHLLRCRVFEGARVRGKYWQVIIDGTQLESSRRELDPRSLYRTHNKGKDNEYREYYYYVLEAKLLLGDDIVVSIMTKFVENEGEEVEKQDCERKAFYRLGREAEGSVPAAAGVYMRGQPVCM